MLDRQLRIETNFKGTGKMKKISGVSKHLYKNYAFEDHLWNNLKPERKDLLELAERCVKIEGTYYLKQPGSGHWISFKTMADAIKEAYNKWLGGVLDCGKTVDADLIEVFFSGVEKETTVIGNKVNVKEVKVGSCPNIQYNMVIPLAEQYVVYNKDTYLNTWCDEMIESDAGEVKLGKLVLEMLYRSLCNGDQLHADKGEESTLLLEQIINNSFTNQDFRFAINWLAAIYQQPGINLQTNLWFCGEQNGVGKGTIVDIMGTILGKSYVGVLNQTEIEAGWNDHLMGKMLIESNEFDTTGKMNGKQWNKWIKGHCVEPTLNIRQRNVTARTVLNIGNYIFTSNEESPLYLDKTDRRNQLIKTTDDVYWKEFASVIQVKYVKKDPQRIAAGFAWILEQVQVDHDFIKSAFINNLKASILADSQNIVEKWITQDELLDKNKWLDSTFLFSEFKKWLFEFAPAEKEKINQDVWAKKLSKLSALGVQKKRSNSRTHYYIGAAVAASAASREDIANEVGEITGDVITVEDNDVKLPLEQGMVLSPMEKIRAKLRRLEAEEEHYR